MSRIRYIKPGFFDDEDLAECSMAARLLFAGLWTIADREGRLEDRPRRIKAKIFPYDEVDTDQLLDELATQRDDSRPPSIIRYVVSGVRYIYIPGWSVHQKPHPKEAKSTIPEPDKHYLGGDEPYLGSVKTTPRTDTTRGYGDFNGDFNGDSKKNSLSDVDTSNDTRIIEEFEKWWKEYGRIGDKARARDLYKWWRTSQGKPVADLFTASTAYRDHCAATGCLMKHAATFLAKPTKTKSAIWPEWAAGEQHGTMEVERSTRRTPICPEHGVELQYNVDKGPGLHCTICDYCEEAR